MTIVPRTPGRTNGIELAGKLIVACHHKAGTSVSFKIFSSIARYFELNVWRKFHEPGRYDPLDPLADWDICFDSHSLVHDLMPIHPFKGWHSVRHPMALVYSAALYHQKCKEPWVDIPLSGFGQKTFSTITDGWCYETIKDPAVALGQKIALYDKGHVSDACFNRVDFNHDFGFGNRTYRDILSQAGSIEEKLIFEMNTFSRGVILDMLRFPKDPRFHTVQVEDISFDRGMKTLRHIFSDIGFGGDRLELCLSLAASHLMWLAPKESYSKHATTGMSESWRQAFRGEVLERYPFNPSHILQQKSSFGILRA